MTNKSGTLYTGVTNNLQRRVLEHKQKRIPGFTSKYKINRLIFYQQFENPLEAIAAEKRIKGWTRAKKIQLINDFNSEWSDLSAGWFDEI